MPISQLKIATRKSPLAMWQAHFVQQQLLKKFPNINIEIIAMTTQGDQRLETTLSKVGGKGLFTKELQQALLSGEADLAVHSMKDVTMELPPGLTIAAICERANPQDALVSAQYSALNEIPAGATIGTSSLRRQSQLQALRPDLEVLPLRGNVNSRLRKLDEGQYAAIILAAAGLERLGYQHRIACVLDHNDFLPAVGQGAVGIECCENKPEVIALLQQLNHADTAYCVQTERAMNAKLNGGCQVPIAGFATLQNSIISCRGLVASPDGKQVLTAQAQGSIEQRQQIGEQVAAQLLDQGAEDILRAIYE